MYAPINEVELFSMVRNFTKEVEVERLNEDPSTFGALLSEFFAKPIQWRYNFSSVEIWHEMEKILEKLQTNADAFVKQEDIDDFLKRIIDMRELKMFKEITSSCWITVTDEVEKLYKAAVYEVGTTVVCVKKILKHNLRKKDFMKVNMPGAIDAKTRDLYIKSTPSGQVGVHISIVDGKKTVSLALCGKDEGGQKPAKLDITSSCRKYLAELA